ncbi:MAG: hypothetical protein R6X02_09360 [Enhygromyxa sp.]
MTSSQVEYIQQLLDSVYPKLNDPNSGEYYFPAFLQNGNYDPYGPFNMQLEITSDEVIKAASAICGDVQINDPSVCPKGQMYVGAQKMPPKLELSNVYIHGLSNAVLQRPIAGGSDGFSIKAHVLFSTLPASPAGAKLKHPLDLQASLRGNFRLTQYCCCCDKGSTDCSGSPVPVVGTGTFVATVNQPGSADGSLQITKLEQNALTIAATSVTLQVPTSSKTGGPDITVSVTIDNFPDNFPPGEKKAYDTLANEAFNDKSAQENVLKQINSLVSAKDVLETFGQVLTNAIDGYLKAHHQYPFNSADASLL